MGSTSSFPHYHTKPECQPDPWCEDWMSHLPDNVYLSDLTIPGTHSSRTSKGRIVDYCKTQAWMLDTQFQVGIRFLDFEFKEANGELLVYSSGHYQHVTLPQCIYSAVSFLRGHKSETIIMRLSYADNKPSQCRTLEKLIKNNAYIWKPSKSTYVPSLGEVRGKLVILQNIPAVVPIGIVEHDDFTDIEFDMLPAVLTTQNISTKWSRVKEHMERANLEENKLIVTFTCGGGKLAFPYSVAHRINQILFDYVKQISVKEKKKLGIIAMNFPGCELVKAIAMLNFDQNGLFLLKSCEDSPPPYTSIDHHPLFPVKYISPIASFTFGSELSLYDQQTSAYQTPDKSLSSEYVHIGHNSPHQDYFGKAMEKYDLENPPAYQIQSATLQDFQICEIPEFDSLHENLSELNTFIDSGK